MAVPRSEGRAAPAGVVAQRGAAVAAVRRNWTRRRRDRGVARFYDNLENWSGCRLNCRCARRRQQRLRGAWIAHPHICRADSHTFRKILHFRTIRIGSPL